LNTTSRRNADDTQPEETTRDPMPAGWCGMDRARGRGPSLRPGSLRPRRFSGFHRERVGHMRTDRRSGSRAVSSDRGQAPHRGHPPIGRWQTATDSCRLARTCRSRSDHPLSWTAIEQFAESTARNNESQENLRWPQSRFGIASSTI
jgi:hypothetical protein